MPLPRLGIVQPVRVCETCYDEITAPKIVKPASSTTVPTASQSGRSLQPRSARIEDEDDRDLKMALQMSLEEARRSGAATSQPAAPRQDPSRPAPQSNPRTDDVEDEDLKAAIAASLKDMEAMKGIQYPSVQSTQPISQQPVLEHIIEYQSAPSQSAYTTQPQV